MALDYVVGIDPGATGAIALYDVTHACVLSIKDTPFDVKVLTTGKRSNRVNFEKLRMLLEDFKNLSLEQGATLHAHIEDVSAYGKQSAPAAFNFGYAAAIPFVMCKMLDMDVRLIHPAVWKNQFHLRASEKDRSRLLAIEMFPHLAHLLARKMDVDRADALLIAMYKPRT